MVAKTGHGKTTAKMVAGNSVTTRQDAALFKRTARKYATHATSSKKKAQDTLIGLGIYTKGGRLSRRYS